MRPLQASTPRIGRVMSQKSFYGWKVLWAFWSIIVLNFTFPTFGTSVVNTYMARAMHFNRTELGIAYSVFSLMAGLPGPLVARSINRFSIRFTLVVGALLTSLGALLMALVVKSVLEVVLVLGFIVGFGGSMAGTMAPQVGLARWFRRKRARAMAIGLSGSAVGGFIAVPTLQAVVAHYGTWRAAWWCMSAMSLCAAVIAVLFVKDSPEQLGQEADGEPAGAEQISAAVPARPPSGVYKTADAWTLGDVLRTPTLWMLVATYLGFFMGFFIYVAHGIAHLEGLGHSPSEAAKSISIVLISTLIGQVAVGTLGDRIEPRFLSAIAVCFYGAGTLLAIHAVAATTMYLYAILMGAGFGTAFTCLQTILSNYYGVKIYPAVLGITLPIGTILGSLGPVTAGYFYDRYGTYAGVFVAIAALCFASAILYLLATPPHRLARTTIEPARQTT